MMLEIRRKMREEREQFQRMGHNEKETMKIYMSRCSAVIYNMKKLFWIFKLEVD